MRVGACARVHSACNVGVRPRALPAPSRTVPFYAFKPSDKTSTVLILQQPYATSPCGERFNHTKELHLLHHPTLVAILFISAKLYSPINQYKYYFLVISSFKSYTIYFPKKKMPNIWNWSQFPLILPSHVHLHLKILFFYLKKKIFRLNEKK